MSVHVISWVLEHSPVRIAGHRLVLIVIADHADKHGQNSWASVETIEHESRMSRRAVQYALRALEEEGHIIDHGPSKVGTHTYSVVMDGGAKVAPAQNQQGRNLRREGGEQIAPEPSLEPSSSTSDEVLRVSQALEAHIKEVTGKEKKLTATDLKTIERMGRIDGQDLDEVTRFLKWLSTDSSEVAQFWAPNILSAKKLREKFPQVRAQVSRRAPNGRGPTRRDGMTEQQHRDSVLEGARAVDERMPRGTH